MQGDNSIQLEGSFLGSEHMSKDQLKMIEMKSVLFDILINNIDEKSNLESFRVANEKFKRCFSIKQLELFIYYHSEEIFYSMTDNPLAGNEQVRIISNEYLNNKEDFISHLQQVGYSDFDDYILFKNDTSEPEALLLIQSTEKWRNFVRTPSFIKFKTLASKFIKSMYQLNELTAKEKKFKLLLDTIESFTSMTKSEKILERMLDIVQTILPTAEIKLTLSQEQLNMNYSYEIFNQSESDSSVVKAFLNGVVTTSTHEDSSVVMNVPITGHQGVYGVLRIKENKDVFYYSTPKSLIHMLVNTTGKSLEKTTLYKQSYQLNEDLKLVNETSQTLNSNLTLDEMFMYLKSQLGKVLRPSEILFLFYDENDDVKFMGKTDAFFERNESEEYIQLASKHIKQDKDSLFIAEFKSMYTESTLYKSVIGIPIMNQEEVIGMAICLHEKKYFFSFDRFKLAESLIRHASLSISNLLLRKQMQELAEKDHLTGLYARRYLEKYIYRVLEEEKGGALLLFDIDDFKRVNDKFGHDVGDKVLKQIGEFLPQEVGGVGVAARWGGEEFAVYFSINEELQLEKITRKLLHAIPAITTPSVTVSMGLVYWEPEVSRGFKTLFKEADRMLYQAKEQGKNQIIICEREVEEDR